MHRLPPFRWERLFLLLLLLTAACGAAAPPPATEAGPESALTLPDGLAATTLPYQFDGPTQFVVADDNLWVAQLNGGENAGQGQVVRVNLDSGARQVVLDGLDKPTGLALLDGALWVATRDAILLLPLDGAGEAETVVDNLPNNGRSNGTLTVTPDGMLLYETSGNRRDEDSGKLWALDPATGAAQALASGLKGAYAHAVDDAGRIWLTEVADGQVDGVTLPDELNLLQAGADFGWPRCYGRELQGPDCDGVRPAVAIFAPHSTPTSVVPSPFAADTLLVALWVAGEVVAVPVTDDGDNATGAPGPFLSGLDNPQHLVALPGGDLLVSDFASGRIYRITRR